VGARHLELAEEVDGVFCICSRACWSENPATLMGPISGSWMNPAESTRLPLAVVLDPVGSIISAWP
jgi:hypothetical protein